MKAALEERFSTSDKAEIREQVVGDRDALVWLEGLLHPRVLQRTEAWRDELSRLPEPPALAVNEVPLLYEAGAEGRFDAVVVITAPRELRADRAGNRLDEREQRLIPDEEKIERVNDLNRRLGDCVAHEARRSPRDRRSGSCGARTRRRSRTS